MAKKAAKDVKKPRGRPPKAAATKKATPAKAAKKATPAKEKPTMAIEAIIDARQARGHTEYCVKWVGFTQKHSTWERANQLDEYDNKDQCIKAFEKAAKAHAKKPTPAKEKAAKKPTPAKEKPAKKATAEKKAPAKKATPTKEKPAKKATAEKKEPAKKPTAEKKAPAKAPEDPAPVKRGRGRPPKAKPAVSEEPAPKRGRGRPPKDSTGDLVKEFMKAESAKKAPKKSAKRARGEEEHEEAANLIASALRHFKTPAKAAKTSSSAKPAAKAKASKPKEAPKKRAASASKAEPAKKKAKSTPKKTEPKKPAAKTKPAKKKSDVFTVKELLNVRKVSGGREYEVKWSVGPNTWEPEKNVSDDLIEEFEAMLIEKASAKTKLKVGSAVEVLNTAAGFEWSWAAGKITATGKKADHFNVEFTLFVDSKGKKLTENNVSRSRLRAPPKAAPSKWTPEIGDKVEVSEDDCWWEATVEKGGKKGQEVRVMLRVSDEKKTFLLKDARPVTWEKLA